MTEFRRVRRGPAAELAAACADGTLLCGSCARWNARNSRAWRGDRRARESTAQRQKGAREAGGSRDESRAPVV